ncbi:MULTISPECIES: hypothetical protein [Bacillus]|uniref:hypothetical protein n=1 Tax=Bacillus TaxID=1386 RepID=UPI0018CF2FED|nr:hypothetical protein [Bacillus cereus]
MDTTNTELQIKIDMLQLCPVNDRVYHEHLKAYEELGIYTERVEYYKMYGQCFVSYSKEYVMRSTKGITKNTCNVSHLFLIA